MSRKKNVEVYEWKDEIFLFFIHWFNIPISMHLWWIERQFQSGCEIVFCVNWLSTLMAKRDYNKAINFNKVTKTQVITRVPNNIRCSLKLPFILSCLFPLHKYLRENIIIDDSDNTFHFLLLMNKVRDKKMDIVLLMKFKYSTFNNFQMKILNFKRWQLWNSISKLIKPYFDDS